MVRKLEDRKVDEASLVERQKQIDCQKKYIREMEDDIVKKKKELSQKEEGIKTLVSTLCPILE